jgi:hypothetical protein
MFFKIFMALLGVVALWGFFYRLKRKPLYFYMSSVVFLVVLYFIFAPYRFQRVLSWFGI